MISNQELGVAGELRVMSELILRGYNPAKSHIDNGVDIILGDGIRIQIKTTNSIGLTIGSRQITPTRGYKFNLKKGNRKNKTLVSEYADFLICVVLSESLFFIMPSKDLTGIGIISIPVNTDSSSKYYKYLNNWEVLRGSSSS